MGSPFFFLSTENQISLRNNHLTKRRSSKFFCNIETGKATAASTVILRLTQAFTLTNHINISFQSNIVMVILLFFPFAYSDGFLHEVLADVWFKRFLGN
jgi:hypothetical protein